MNTRPHDPITWRKSSHSTATDTCVELAYIGIVRDSKNLHGPTLRIDITNLLIAVKSDQLNRATIKLGEEF